MERLYKDGSTMPPHDNNYEVWDTLPSIDCCEFNALALLHVVLANIRQEPAERCLEHHLPAHLAAKSILIVCECDQSRFSGSFQCAFDHPSARKPIMQKLPCRIGDCP
jgi:hypothetical protein